MNSVSVHYCCMTKHPRTKVLKTTIVIHFSGKIYEIWDDILGIACLYFMCHQAGLATFKMAQSDFW